MQHLPQQLLSYLIKESRNGLSFTSVVNKYMEEFKDQIKLAEKDTIVNGFKNESENYPNFEFIQSVLKYQYIKDADTNKYFLIDPASKVMEVIKEDALKAAFSPKAFVKLNSEKLYVARIGYNPNSTEFLYKEGLIKSVNMYRPAEWQVPYFFDGTPVPKSKMPKCYKDYIEHLTGGSELSYEYTINFLASCVQTNKKSFSYYTMLGTQGIGKGVFFAIITELVGKKNADTIDATALAELKFNDKMKNKKVLLFDELTIRNSADENALKQMVNETLDIESKGVDKKSYTNYANIMIASNSLHNMKIDLQDRRYSFVDTTKVKLTKYIKKNYPEHTMDKYIKEVLMSPDNIKQFGEYLLNFEIQSKYLEEPITSEAKKNQRFNMLQDWEVSVFRELCPKNAGKELPLNEAKTQLQDITQNSKVNPGREKWKHLSEVSVGFFEVKKKTRDNGEQYYTIKFANKEDMPKYIASETEE